MAKRIAEMIVVMAVWFTAIELLPADAGGTALETLISEAAFFGITIADVLVAKALFRDHVRMAFPGDIRKGHYVGAAAGIIMILLTVGLTALSGVLHVYEMNHIPDFWMWFTAAALNATAYVVLLDGYLYQVLRRLFGGITAMTIVSLLYTLVHPGSFAGGVLSIINSMLMNMALVEILEFSRSLLAPLCTSTIWNWIGGLIFGGIYCMRGCPSLFNTAYEGRQMLGGNADMIEGSLITTGILLVTIILFAWLAYGRNRRGR